VEPGAAAMVGDSYADDIEGARALGMRAFLLDRDDRFPDEPDRLPTLLALPAALGLGSL
jgi:FMN phosphatase YigB (HAD superfamily)